MISSPILSWFFPHSYTYTDPSADAPTTYYFTPCGMTSQTCVTKNPATGMGVRISEDSSGNTCDVLGSFSDDFAEWTPLLEDDTGDFIGLQLNGGNGSPCQAGGSHPVEPTPYRLVTNFNCYVGNPKDRIKASPAGTAFVASSGSSCSPIFQINTCLACADGCSLPSAQGNSSTTMTSKN